MARLAFGQRDHAPGRAHQSMHLRPPARSESISTSSVEPPPISKMSAGPSPGSSSAWQPSTARRASSSARDDVERDAGLATDALDEMAAVDRAAAGFGRDRAGERDVAAAQLVRADAKRGDGAVHRRVGQPAASPASPSPSRTTREKASMTMKPSSDRARRSEGGNYWCRGPAPHRCGA